MTMNGAVTTAEIEARAEKLRKLKEEHKRRTGHESIDQTAIKDIDLDADDDPREDARPMATATKPQPTPLEERYLAAAAAIAKPGEPLSAAKVARSMGIHDPAGIQRVACSVSKMRKNGIWPHSLPIPKHHMEPKRVEEIRAERIAAAEQGPPQPPPPKPATATAPPADMVPEPPKPAAIPLPRVELVPVSKPPPFPARDPELVAIEAVLHAIGGLTDDRAKGRVLEYLRSRFA